ncbi:hypothetical protein CPC08DRAFT_771752 [Agrocybe pediades]|nr:hypothetical protein CPC08DRAFT_771752 [Agrocybe pediades]
MSRVSGRVVGAERESSRAEPRQHYTRCFRDNHRWFATTTHYHAPHQSPALLSPPTSTSAVAVDHLQSRSPPSGKAWARQRTRTGWEGAGRTTTGVVSNGHHWATTRTHEPHPTPPLPTAYLQLRHRLSERHRRHLRGRRRRRASPPSSPTHPLPLRHLTTPPSPLYASLSPLADNETTLTGGQQR